MSDIQKIKLIHDVKNVLGIDAELAHKLADQIEDSEIKERINSFFASYKVEDIFQYLFSVLPSVRLIHKLDQNQLPSTSKADFQVPDFLVLFRTSKGVDKALLVDIKFAQRNKLTFNIMQNQHLISKNYSFTLNIELLYAIYWQNYIQIITGSTFWILLSTAVLLLM